MEAKVNVLEVVVSAIGQDIANIKATKAEISDISNSHLDTWNIDELARDLKKQPKCIKSPGLGSIYIPTCYYYWHYFISKSLCFHSSLEHSWEL